jgi:hypothetical protein
MTNYFYNTFGECNYNSNIELLTNTNYTSMNFTTMNLKKIKSNTDNFITGYLKDCKDFCDNNKDCIGFSREKDYFSDKYPVRCYLNKNFDICNKTNFIINDYNNNTYINDKGMEIIQNNLIKFSYKYDNMTNPISGVSNQINTPIIYNLGVIQTCGLLNTINCEISSSEERIPPAPMNGIGGSFAELQIIRPNMQTPLWKQTFFCVDNDSNPIHLIFNKLPNSIILQKGDQINLILTGILPGYIAQIGYINIEFNKDINNLNVF